MTLAATEQGSDSWKRARLGCVTASRLADVMATIKTGEAAARANYRAELIAQRLTGQVEEGFTNAAMQWGTDQEPFARAAYELYSDSMVEQVGFITHPSIKWSGASPDGLIADKGLVEIKCPNMATHIAYLIAGAVPSKYMPQMTWQLACTGREWCDFVSFDPRLPDDFRLFVVRYRPEETRIAEAETAVKTFLQEIDDAIAKLMAIKNRNDLINTP